MDHSAKESASSAWVTLRVTAGPHAGQEFEFEHHATLVVGRSESAQLSVADDPFFSRFHCRLEIRPPECFLVDLGSRNGTFVNGERVTETFLQNGDEVSGGHTRIVVEVSDPQLTRNEPAPSSTISYQRSPNDNSALAPAQQVAGYDLLEELGRGTMGVVFRAVRRSTGQQVAIKFILPERQTGLDVAQIFVREASILSRLSHPLVIQFFEFGLAERAGLDGPQMFLAMEYVPVESWDRIVSRLSIAKRIRLAVGVVCQMLDALSHAHALGLVHRDIKPSNLLLMRDKQRLKVKLADFGLAKNYVDAGFSGITRDGQIRGTAAFMSPDQVIDCRNAQPACDIYSAGATLYFLISGRFPHEFPPGQSVFTVILNEDVVPLTVSCPTVPARLAEMVHRAMARNSSDRFPSAKAMRRALLPFSRRSE